MESVPMRREVCKSEERRKEKGERWAEGGEEEEVKKNRMP